MKISRRPKAIRRGLGGRATAARWYENAKSIDVVIECRTEHGVVTGIVTGIGRIHRSDLADWLKRTESTS